MIKIIKRTGHEFSNNNCMQMAAALAYYTVFSLPPLLVIVVSVAGMFVGEEDVRTRVESETRAVVGDRGAAQIGTMISHAQKPGRGVWGTVIGGAMLLFGATGVMVQLQASLNQAWDVKPDPRQGGARTFLVKRILSLAMILAIAFLMLVSLVISTILNTLHEQVGGWLPVGLSRTALGLAHGTVSYLVITVLFAGMYKYLPDVKVAWRDVWLGGALTAALFVLAKWGLGVYLAHSDIASTYGAAGALALILVWIYYSGVIFLLGAEFTQVWARHHGRGFEPADGAVRAKTAGA
jgi:membrane protein